MTRTVPSAIPDEAALAELYRELTPGFCAYLRRAACAPADVDDLLQDTWLRIVERRASLANGESYRAWMWTVCRHTFVDWLRAQKRRAKLYEKMLMSDESPVSDEASRAVGEREAEWECLVRRVDEAIMALPDRQFEVVTYRWILEYSTELTASLMKVAPGTVKAALHQAGNNLRAHLGAGELDDGPAPAT